MKSIVVMHRQEVSLQRKEKKNDRREPRTVRENNVDSKAYP